MTSAFVIVQMCSENSETAEETWLCDAACLARCGQRADDLQPFCQPHGCCCQCVCVV